MRAIKLYEKQLRELELKRDKEIGMVKADLREGYEYVQPINLLKRTLAKAVKSIEIREDLIQIGLNLVTKAISKKTSSKKTETNKVEAKSKGSVKTWLSSTLQSLLVQFLNKNSETIKAGLINIFQKLITTNNKSENETSQETETSETKHFKQAS